MVNTALMDTLEKLVADRTGLVLPERERRRFEQTISERFRLRKVASIDDYCALLNSDTVECREEWKSLVRNLTTGETYFFRDKGQFAVLEERILPELIEKRKNARSLRIWSAGCSSGEEPYSLAILLDELLPARRDWNISIVGTDINEDAIEKARKGLYTHWSFRMVEPEMQKRYFKRRKDEWDIDERLRNSVRFSSGNLIDDLFPSHEICNMDLILCRNVFIYFNSDAISAVVAKFVDTLNEGGYLITGHGELHLHGYTGLKARIFPESVVYQKIAEPERREASFVKREASHEIRDTFHEIRKTSHVSQDKISSQSVIEKSLIELAQEYADRGEYEKAEESCKRALEAEPYSARCYYLLSQISEAQGREEEAIGLLKKAIYLEPSFVAAYLELGYTYDKHCDAARARKMRETAVGLLEKLSQDTLVKPYKDITAGELLEYVRKMLIVTSDE